MVSNSVKSLALLATISTYQPSSAAHLAQGSSTIADRPIALTAADTANVRMLAQPALPTIPEQEVVVAQAAATAVPPGFDVCAACHSTEPKAEGIGPSLFGVFDTKAATGTFPFSAALKASNIVWNEESLNEFLKAPAKRVPGTMMPFAGIKDDAERAEIVKFLKTLK